MERVTDIHQHLVYGMDDGAQSREDMFAMLRRAADEGIGRIVATPHAVPGVEPFNREDYYRRLDEADDYCRQNGLDIELEEGAEILYTDQTCRFLQEGLVPTLAQSDFVLVEFSPDVPFERLYGALERLAQGGFLPVVAHVERYRCLTMRPANALRVKDSLQVYFQVNCASVLDGCGFWANRFLRKMFEHGMIDAVATDAHNVSSRPARMKAARAALARQYGEDYASRLTDGELIFE